MLKMAHGKSLKERYQLMVKELGEVKTVFEPLCGPALLPKYLPAGVKYSGFDLNEKFVKHAKKKKFDVWQGNAKEELSYKDVRADGVVLIDALHHIQPYKEQQKVVERSAKSAKKRLIIFT